jgi:hypothetical protein
MGFLLLTVLPYFIVAGALLGHPIATPRDYVTQNYNLRFRGPANTTICPLPADWVGSDHGTVIFLSPPTTCGGYGYASSQRASAPDRPRIEVFYGYAMDDDVPLPICRAVVRVTLLKRRRRACLTAVEAAGDVRIEARAPYLADSPAEIDIALVTTKERMAGDLQTFRAFTATVRTCAVHWVDSKTGHTHVAGAGSPCPPSHWW